METVEFRVWPDEGAGSPQFWSLAWGADCFLRSALSPLTAGKTDHLQVFDCALFL